MKIISSFRTLILVCLATYLSACQQQISPNFANLEIIINGTPSTNTPNYLQLISHGQYTQLNLTTPQLANAEVLEWNPEGTMLAACGTTLLIYKLEENKVVFSTQQNTTQFSRCSKVKWSSDAQKLLVVQVENSGATQVVVYNTNDWKPIDVLRNGTIFMLSSNNAVDMSSDGKELIVISGTKLKLINLEQYTFQIIQLAEGGIFEAAFSPNSERLALLKSNKADFSEPKISTLNLQNQQEEILYTPSHDGFFNQPRLKQLHWLDNDNLDFIFQYNPSNIQRFRIFDTNLKSVSDEIPLNARYNTRICLKMNAARTKFMYIGYREGEFGGEYPTTFLLEKIEPSWINRLSYQARIIIPFTPQQTEGSSDAFPTPDQLTYVGYPTCFGTSNEQKLAFALPAVIKSDAENYSQRTAINVFDFDINTASTESNEPLRPPVLNSIFEGRFTHYANIYASRWSPDGKMFITGGRDGQIKLFDAPAQQLLQSWRFGQSSVYSLDWSPDSQAFASGDENGEIEIWNAKTKTPQGKLLGHTNTVRSLAWNPTQPLLVSGSWDRTIRLWNTATQTLLQTLSSHTGDVHAVAWNGSGTQFASASSDATVKIWNVDGTEQRTLLGATAPLLTVAWSPDNTKIAAAGWDKTIFVWEASTGNLLQKITGSLGAIRSLEWLSNNAMVAGGTDKYLRIFTLETQLTLNGVATNIRHERSLKANVNIDLPHGFNLTEGIQLPDNDRDGYDHDIFTISLDPSRKKMVVGVKNGKLRIFGVK